MTGPVCGAFTGDQVAALARGASFLTDPGEERSLAGFLAHLDRLWDDGVLPQSFAVA